MKTNTNTNQGAQTMTTIITETMRMTREALEAEHVADGVARWGESERNGLAKQAAAKSIETLRADHLTRTISDETQLREALDAIADPSRPLCYQAIGCLDEGES